MTENAKKIIAQIMPSAEYSLAEIVRDGLMGEGKSYFVCRNIINEDRWKKNGERILNAEKRGEGRGTYYYVKGKNLIKYLKQTVK